MNRVNNEIDENIFKIENKKQKSYDLEKKETDDLKDDHKCIPLDNDFFNRYATKKTFSSGLLDGALLATNAAQLRLLLTDGIYKHDDPKWYICLSLVSVSIIAQVIMLVLLAVLANSNLAQRNKTFYLDVMNNIVLILTGIIFCINIIANVFIQVDVTTLLGNKTI